jgi:hypothetical protein
MGYKSPRCKSPEEEHCRISELSEEALMVLDVEEVFLAQEIETLTERPRNQIRYPDRDPRQFDPD